MSADRSRWAFLLVAAPVLAGFATMTLGAGPETEVVPAGEPAVSSASGAEAGLTSSPAAAAAVRTTRLQGSAHQGRRTPVVGVAVVVQAAGQLDRFLVTCTDPKGRFRIDGVPEGTYDVFFLKDGYERVEKTGVNVSFPFRPTVEVRMTPRAGDAPMAASAREFPAERVTVRGRVVNGDGEPVPDVLLRLVRRDGSVDPVTARSGPDGAFAVDDVPTGWWDAEVLAVGFLPIRAPLPLERSLDVLTQLVPHPTKYDSSPIDLLPKEQPIPPADLVSQAGN